MDMSLTSLLRELSAAVTVTVLLSKSFHDRRRCLICSKSIVTPHAVSSP